MAGDEMMTEALAGAASGGGIAALWRFYDKWVSDRKLERMSAAIARVHKNLTDHKLHAAEKFATKRELKDAVESFEKKLDRMDSKLDGLIEAFK